MHSLQKQFHDFILSNHLVKKGEKILLAVSGGLDSMVMAHLFLKEEIPFAIAHCNFGLRGEESDDDEAFVLDWADQHNVNCYVKGFDLSSGSIQLAARNARYSWFNELVLEHHFDKIATAHHLNDSLETLLLNLSRGTGIKGVSGIVIKNNQIIRPLLFAEKQRLYDYAMDNDLDWREDSSNQKVDYDRNLLRHDVIPDFLKLNPSMFKTFGLTLERLTHASDIVHQQVNELKARHLTVEGSGYRLNLEWINKPSDELMLAELLAPYGVNYVTAKDIFEARGKSGKSFPVKDWLITLDRDVIYIDQAGEEKKVEVSIGSAGEYGLNGGRILVEQITKKDVVFGDADVAHFDADKLRYPFVIRSWENGDRFQPLGMKGEKKVSDYLIDEKIPLASKKKVLVIECNGKIAWVVGMRIADNFKLTEASSSVIKLTFYG
ncbi:tRNA lysidine(34) synthetase TilS [Ekhidna sp.]|uniref:tRNA lysidine(34) synthetase TilS n=1 Tax=Ekhidna sp. TaxID=2608089 RepID=UPI003BA9A087